MTQLTKIISLMQAKRLILTLTCLLVFVSCGINTPLTYYAIDDNDLVFIKAKPGDLNKYTASIITPDFTTGQTQTAIISIDRSLSTDLFPSIDESDLREPGILLEQTSIVGFNQLKNDIREKHIATSATGVKLLYAIRTRNAALYYLRAPGEDNFGVAILPNTITDLETEFSADYTIEKCTQPNDCIPVGTYNLNIKKLGRDSEVKTPVGIFDTFQINTRHQFEINDEDYRISYTAEEFGLVNPSIGLVKFSLDYNDSSNLDSNVSLSIIAQVTQIDLPELIE